MKKLALVLALGASMFVGQAMAQTAAVCDVYYLLDVNTATNDVSTVKTWVYGVPAADLNDNSAKGKRVIEALSKADGKGGPYEIEVGEWRTCDGVTTKNLGNSIMAKGITLKDGNKINRIALKIMDEVQTRYDKRGEKGDKEGWKHDKARKIKRNDIGYKQHTDPQDQLAVKK